MFDACETRKCVNVTITDDMVDEQRELFTYTLTRTPSLDPRIELDPIDGTVEIINSDVPENVVVAAEPASVRVSWDGVEDADRYTVTFSQVDGQYQQGLCN
ncbi:hypothetical protein GBAR_LOCUS20653, partial [Geodia barretti]